MSTSSARGLRALVTLAASLCLGAISFGANIPLPGVVSATAYTSFFDIDSATNNSVIGPDLATCSEGGQDVGWINATEWLEYDIVGGESAILSVTARVASLSNSVNMDLLLDGTKVASCTATSSGAWQTWKDANFDASITLQQGQAAKLRVVFTGSGFNLQKLTFTKTGIPPTLSLDTANSSFEPAGGTKTVQVSSNIAWAAASDVSWLTVSPVSGTSSGTITLAAAANPGAQRTATVTVQGGAFVRPIGITQAAMINTPPTITTIANQSIRINTATEPVAFTIGDAETPATSLTLLASSSTPALLPPAGIVFAGSGANRTITLTPAANEIGTASVDIQVNDANGGSASSHFTLTVNPTPPVPILDRNGDGISDVWSALYPNAGAPAADPDGDGQSNLTEAQAGTDPTDPASRYITTAGPDAAGNLVAHWPSVAGKHYFIECSPDLSSWAALPGEYSGTGTELSAIVRPAGAVGGSRSFWRVVVFDADSDASGLNDWEKTHLDQVATITATAGAHGTITPSGKAWVAKGDTLAFTITPASGYAIAGVQVDGLNIGAVATYTFGNLTASHSISADFATRILSLSESSIAFENSGGSQNIAVNANVAWAVTNIPAWLTVTPQSGSGSGTITISAAANSGSNRTSSITVGNGEAGVGLSITQGYSPPVSPRTDISLDTGWKFNRSDISGAAAPSFDDSGWSTVAVPHTWNAQDGQNGGSNYYRGIGWYRRHFTISADQAGRRYYLQFDGSNIVTNVFVNGTGVGAHSGGFAAFRFDITQYVHVGADNIIAVKVNNASNADIPPLSGDFTFFGGLYRGVHLFAVDSLQFRMLDYGSSGVYLKQSLVSETSANLEITAKSFNNYGSAKSVTLETTIVDATGNVVDTLSTTHTIPAGTGYDFVQTTTIDHPHLWNGLTDPYLYKVYLSLKDGATVTDSVSQPLGLRYFRVDASRGFFLNGRYLDLHGVNRHQDRLNLGWAIGNAQHLEDFQLIEEMGATAIRLAHYQHAQYFYDLCDTNGMIVWAEIPLINSITESTAFYANAKQQLTELIRQNYNHPAICFWSIANEITLAAGPDTNNLLTQLETLASTEDPTRLTTIGSNAWDGSPVNWHTDLVDFNKYYGWYYGGFSDFAGWADGIHASYPAKCIGVSEYGAGSGLSLHSLAPTEGDHTEEYQNLFHEAHWLAMKTRPFLWSKFVWNMFDFAADARNEGDTPGRNDKGLVSFDRRIKKDAYFWYKANWSTAPMVYITSRRFTQRTSRSTPIKVYANCDSVELRINGVSKGVHNATGDRIFTWTGMTLAGGANTIEVIGTKSGVLCSDTVTWTAN